MPEQTDQVIADDVPRPLARALAALPRPSTTPFTFCYLVVLLGTTIVLHTADPSLTSKLLALSSTDAHNLWHRPLLTLFTSALWLADAMWLVNLVIFTIAVAPLERRIGPLWTAAVFFSGHVLATLATELPVMWSVSAGALTAQDARWVDVGVSYGFFATAGALVALVAPPMRRWAVLTAETVVLLVYVTGRPGALSDVVTLAGHLFALHLGMLAWQPWLRRRGLVGSVRFRRRELAPPLEGLAEPVPTA
ncbi:rhomboid-like protein [Amycolatopsis sp. CA-230715]|uniref:rhomboid-like protein n=1 Tax=Amycolatopsis sp. CA-230715 TaxID=2745196 RepID=UPI001C011745|nr:rhomboid-like protein [Amycolatopsis sp. CA-230715]QWF77121.1 hypothetical protein HUW46_00501 [Amycolatopsis sp. CA-230715]